MHNVLLVYKQLSLQFDEYIKLLPSDDEAIMHSLSYDEKPKIQTITNTSDKLMPVETSDFVKRDYEYKRFGTVLLLARIDLQISDAIHFESDTHNNNDYIVFLKMLDDKYPKGDKIRLILNNLRVHTSQKVIKYLETCLDRFEFIFTTKHVS